MEQWVIIIIIIACLIVVYLITGFILRKLMKRAENKAVDELIKVAPYEVERLELIKSLADTLKERNYGFPKQFKELIDETEEILNTRPVDVSKAKGNLDFLIMYFRKYITEKKLTSQTVFSEYLDKLNSHIFLDTRQKDSPYYNYNKAALHYNAYFGLILFAPFLSKKKKLDAPVL